MEPSAGKQAGARIDGARSWRCLGIVRTAHRIHLYYWRLLAYQCAHRVSAGSGAGGVLSYLGVGQTFRWSIAFVSPMLMALYGAGQTLWSDQKILANGWEKTLYWFTAAIIAMLATQLFRTGRLAQQFRMAFALLGGGLALLDVLQQASHTGKYSWLFPSGFPDVYGTFAYYNNFSQFIEMTLPITLWLGLNHREPRYNWLLLSALQIGAVVACGSRAGAALVVAELLAVLLLASPPPRHFVVEGDRPDAAIELGLHLCRRLQNGAAQTGAPRPACHTARNQRSISCHD